MFPVPTVFRLKRGECQKSMHISLFSFDFVYCNSFCYRWNRRLGNKFTSTFILSDRLCVKKFDSTPSEIKTQIDSSYLQEIGRKMSLTSPYPRIKAISQSVINID